MTSSGLKATIGSVAAGAILTLAAHGAQAGGLYVGPVTVHEFNANLKGAFQDENGNGDDRIGHESANQKKLLEECIGQKLEKHEKIVLVTDCGNSSNPAYVLVVDTDVDPNDPAIILGDIGYADFDLYAEQENNSGDPTQAVFEINGELYCEDEDDYFVSFSGFAKAQLKPLDPKDSESPICTHSANGKFLGTGDFFGTDAVLENGSFNAGARSKKILLDDDDINDWFFELVQ